MSGLWAGPEGRHPLKMTWICLSCMLWVGPAALARRSQGPPPVHLNLRLRASVGVFVVKLEGLSASC